MTRPHIHKPAWKGTNWRKAMDRAHSARRCTARCKHSKLPCKGPAVKGWTVCRKHGARGGGPRGEKNGAYRHGRHTIEAKQMEAAARAERRETRALILALRQLGYPL